MQIEHINVFLEDIAISLNRQCHGLADMTVQNRLEWNEIGHVVAVRLYEDVADFQYTVGDGPRNDLLNDEHSRLFWKLLPDRAFGFLPQSQAPQLVKSLVSEHGRQRAATDGGPGLN